VTVTGIAMGGGSERRASREADWDHQPPNVISKKTLRWLVSGIDLVTEQEGSRLTVGFHLRGAEWEASFCQPRSGQSSPGAEVARSVCAQYQVRL
jgi:hypothetical protein